MAIRIRKWATFREEIVVDGERDLERPLRRVAVAVVCTNPYAGRWSDDLAELIDFGEFLGDELMRRCQEALEATRSRPTARAASSASTASSSTSPPSSTRSSGSRPVARTTACRSCRRSRSAAAMGATLDIPVHHIKAMLVRSHFDAVEICVPDAPGADELLLALAVTNAGRPHARIGGLAAADAVGDDGLH